MSLSVAEVQAEIDAALERLEKLFKSEVKVTFLARHTEIPTAHMLLSNCSFDEIREALDDLENKPRLTAPLRKGDAAPAPEGGAR